MNILKQIDILIEEENKFYNQGKNVFSQVSNAYGVGWGLQNILRNTGNISLAGKMGSGVNLVATGALTSIAAGLALGIVGYGVFRASKLIKKYRNKRDAEKHASRIYGNVKLVKIRKK